jgi:hypothetical protein
VTNALGFTYVHSVTVDTYLGTRNGVPSWDSDNAVACWVEESTDLVRDSSGTEVVSTAKVFASLGDRSKFLTGSKVTLPSGRVARVLLLSVFDSGALNLGLDHVEAHLT